MTKENEEMTNQSNEKVEQKARDLEAEHKSFQRMIERQSEASRSYMDGKFQSA